MRSRLQRLTAFLLVLHAIADWLDLRAMWQIPIVVAMFACAVILVAEARTREDGHVTLNLRA